MTVDTQISTREQTENKNNAINRLSEISYFDIHLTLTETYVYSFMQLHSHILKFLTFLIKTSNSE